MTRRGILGVYFGAPLDFVRFPLAVLTWIVQFPLMLLFYIVRSAWHDARLVGTFLRASVICEHGVDRARGQCQTCNRGDEQQIIADLEAQLLDNDQVARN